MSVELQTGLQALNNVGSGSVLMIVEGIYGNANGQRTKRANQKMFKQLTRFGPILGPTVGGQFTSVAQSWPKRAPRRSKMRIKSPKTENLHLPKTLKHFEF